MLSESFFNLLPESSNLILIIAGIAFLESLAFAGIFVPGVALLFLGATLAGQQGIELNALLISAFAGAVLGDGLSFIAGRYLAQPVRRMPIIRNHPEWLSKGENFFARYGIISIVIGRFIGPIRPVVPFVAGTCQMKPLAYFPLNLASALIWSPVYIIPGYLTGVAAENISINWPLLIETLIIIGAMLLIFSTSHKWLTDNKHSLTAPLVALLTASASFSALLFIQTTQTLEQWNQETFTLLHPTNNSFGHLIKDIAGLITSLGDSLLVFSAGAVICFWLYRYSSKTLMFTFAALLVSGKAFNSLLKIIFANPRPPSGQHLSTFSFPSGHSSAASTLFLLCAVIFAYGYTTAARRWIYLSAACIAALVALSRVVLGVHWPLDVITGFIEGIIFAAIFRLLLPRSESGLSTSNKEKSQLLIWLACLCTGYILVSAFS